jgi:Spy/CpxP family protein refolding chaperone
MKKPALLAGLLLAITFGAGALTGVAIDRWVGKSPEPGTRITRDYSGVLEALDLTPEQDSRARALMEESAPASEAVLRKASEELRQVADSVDRRLRALLTAEQQIRLDSLRRAVFIIKRRLPSGATTTDTLRPR